MTRRKWHRLRSGDYIFVVDKSRDYRAIRYGRGWKLVMYWKPWGEWELAAMGIFPTWRECKKKVEELEC